jgi:predicted metal-dependent hydrolase
MFVVCGGIQGQPARFKGRRAQLAAAAAGLVIVRQVTVVTREGKPPLFAVYVMRKADEVLQEQQQWMQQQQSWMREQQQVRDVQQSPFEHQVAAGQLEMCEELFLVQHADGRHSKAWHDARAAMGLPPLR